MVEKPVGGKRACLKHYPEKVGGVPPDSQVYTGRKRVKISQRKKRSNIISWFVYIVSFNFQISEYLKKQVQQARMHLRKLEWWELEDYKQNFCFQWNFCAQVMHWSSLKPNDCDLGSNCEPCIMHSSGLSYPLLGHESHSPVSGQLPAHQSSLFLLLQTCPFLLIFLNAFLNGHATKWDLWRLAASFSWVPTCLCHCCSYQCLLQNSFP